MAVPADDHLGSSREGTFKNAVIRRVSFDDSQAKIRLHQLRRFRQKCKVVNDLRRGEVKLRVVENSLNLFQKIGREQQLVAVVKARTDDLLRSAAPAQG